MYKDLFNEIGGQVDELRIACERQEVYYKTMISTYEVTSGQQVIQIKKLEQAVEELKVDSANRQTAIDIERKKLINKHDELKSLGRAERDNAHEGWDLADSYNIKIEEYLEIIDEQVTEIKNLQMELKSSDAEMDSLLEQNEILYGSMESLELEVKDLGQVNKYLSDTADGYFYRLLEIDPSYAPDGVPLDVQGGTPLHNPDILECEVCSLDAIDVENLEKGLAGGEEHTLTDESLILQYTGVIEAEDNPFPGKTTPVPYPYTHPIREVPEYSKVHIPV